MTKLTDTQRVILSTASQRTDRLALPLPKSIKGGAALKVINPLIQRGLIEEVVANRKLGDPVWRETGDGHGVTLIITDAGLDAMGVEPGTTRSAAKTATHGEDTEATAAIPDTAHGPTTPATPAQGRKTREGTKQALIISMLGRPEGASIAEIAEASGWLSHTIRGMIAGSLKKKLGLTIASDKVEGRGRVYKIAA
jgi:hypothetical protein